MNKEKTKKIVNSANEALKYLYSAKDYLKEASQWGLADLFGGGFFITAAKHERIDRAKREMFIAKRRVQDFYNMLNMGNSLDMMQINNTLTMADYLLDGLATDIFVQVKISKAKRQCESVINQLEAIKQYYQNG